MDLHIQPYEYLIDAQQREYDDLHEEEGREASFFTNRIVALVESLHEEVEDKYGIDDG